MSIQNTIKLNVEQVAAICHEANREYGKKVGVRILDWTNLPEVEHRLAMAKVQEYLDEPKLSEAELYDSWVKAQLKAGWKGRIKVGDLEVAVKVFSEDRKEDPLCVPFKELPPAIQGAERVFKGIVDALRSLT